MDALLQEPGLIIPNLLTLGMPFGGFLLGLILRHFAFKTAASSTFLQKLAVGLPIALILISSFNALLAQIGQPSFVSVVFMTGYADDAHVTASGLALNDILRKPFTEDELADAINTQLTDTADETDPTQ